MITFTSIPVILKQFYDPYLLNPLYGMFRRVEDKIKPLSKKKIRIQDVGKSKEFEELLIKFQDTYERKKIEKEEYDTKIKNSTKRSSIPTTGGTIRFTRFQS